MKEIEFSSHAKDMLVERNISIEYVYRVIKEPDSVLDKDDGTTHYIKPISENEGRILRVVTVSKGNIIRVITQFYDRRAGRKR